MLRRLSVAYFVGASVFTGALVIERNPGSADVVAIASVEATRTMAAAVVRPLILASGYTPRQATSPHAFVAIAPPPPARWVIPIMPPSLVQQESSVAPVQLARVAERLRNSLSPELLANFGLFLYVSKAAHGPLAQRLYVFRKDEQGALTPMHNWQVSTGHDAIERLQDGTVLDSLTPEGYFELDPHRMFKNHVSGEWHASMPFSMFFNYVHDGRMTGVAIHSITGNEARLLGHRASHGCIRLGRANAEALFNLVRTKYRGTVPRFAFDDGNKTTARDGALMRDAGGNIVKTNGYQVLVFVENYGGKDVVATLF